MIRKLLIVAASGFALAILSFSAAWIIGGREALARFHRDGHISIPYDDGDEEGPTVTRSVNFDPNTVLGVETAVSLRFIRGDKTEMTVKGPEAVMKSLQWNGNVLSLGKYTGPFHEGLEVRIVAPKIAGLRLDAPGDVELRDLDQDSFHLSVDGAGSITASGRVRTLVAESSGASDLDLARLEARDAKIAIDGVGNADISASDSVDASISGAGNISLRQKPKVLTSRISGVGSIDEDY